MRRGFFLLILTNFSLCVFDVELPPTDRMMKHIKGCNSQTTWLTCLFIALPKFSKLTDNTISSW